VAHVTKSQPGIEIYLQKIHEDTNEKMAATPHPATVYILGYQQEAVDHRTATLLHRVGFICHLIERNDLTDQKMGQAFSGPFVSCHTCS
jgi:hypothetical protein